MDDPDHVEILPAGTVVDGELLDAVIALGDANRKSLGFLPWAGFAEAAHRGCLVVARSARGEVAGYCLYALTLSHVRVVHLCVSAGHRGRDLAARLVDEVQARHPDRLGLRLKCRRDWAANAMWPHLGFVPLTERPGRSTAGHHLTSWHRSNAHEDLFTVGGADPDVLTVAIDSNVFCDLHGRRAAHRTGFSGAVALLAGEQSVKLVLTRSVAVELNNTSDPAERRRLVQTSATYPLLHDDRAATNRTRDDLVQQVLAHELDADPSLLDDAGLVAECITGGADVFVSRDANLVRLLGPYASERYGVAVIDPTELQAFVRRKGADDYQPARLAETPYVRDRGEAAHWSGPDVRALLDNPGGERRAAFDARLRMVAERSTTDLDRQLLLDPGGRVAAAWATGLDGGHLVVPLLRVGAGPLRSTIEAQLAFALQKESVARGARRIVIEDPHVGDSLLDTLAREGFTRSPEGRLHALALDVCTSWDEVRAIAEGSGYGPLPDEGKLSVARAAELERVWWPVKIVDAPLRSYLVPIRGVFADELLGHVPTLLTRDAALGLSREHVYYRSPGSQPTAPGRILWYSSGRDQQVVACSRLVESLTGAPESLHQAFRHLGVWDLATVRAAAKRGVVGALRFADTEILERPVPLDVLRRLSSGVATLPGQGPRRIDGALFASIYREGRRL